MDNTLSPREIQTRIRAGESVEDLVADSGMSEAAIEPFAAPVLAEREHVVGQALSSPIRKKGESSSARSLRQVVREHLQQRSVDIDSVEWDSWREPDRRWTVVARFQDDEGDQDARFVFDTRGRFSVASDDAARGLIGEHRAKPASNDPDSEPTVELDDDMALVRATQPGKDATPAEAADENPPASVDFATQAPETPSVTTVDEAHDDLVGHESQLDVLYDMLSAFDEDSVNIYADLNVLVVEELADEESGQAEDLVLPAESDEPDAAGDAAAHDEMPEAAASVESDQPEPVAEPAPQDDAREDAATDDLPEAAASVDADEPTSPAEPEPAAPAEPEQDPLVDMPAPKPRPRTRKGRASVPSWDEIMFGGPRPSGK